MNTKSPAFNAAMTDMQDNIKRFVSIRDARIKRLAPVSAKIVELGDKAFGTEVWLKAQGLCDYIVPAFGVSTRGSEDMVVGAKEGAIYITKEVAMAFFDLVEKPVTKEVK